MGMVGSEEGERGEGRRGGDRGVACSIRSCVLTTAIETSHSRTYTATSQTSYTYRKSVVAGRVVSCVCIFGFGDRVPLVLLVKDNVQVVFNAYTCCTCCLNAIMRKTRGKASRIATDLVAPLHERVRVPRPYTNGQEGR